MVNEDVDVVFEALLFYSSALQQHKISILMMKMSEMGKMDDGRV